MSRRGLRRDVTRGETESKLAFSRALGARRGETVALIRRTDAVEARDRVARTYASPLRVREN